jgi:hypothetical protein
MVCNLNATGKKSKHTNKMTYFGSGRIHQKRTLSGHILLTNELQK